MSAKSFTKIRNSFYEVSKRLKSQKHALFEQQSYTLDLQNQIKIAKSEAIREFAEALKNKVSVDLSCGVDSADYLDDVLFNDIDRLVEEISKQ